MLKFRPVNRAAPDESRIADKETAVPFNFFPDNARGRLFEGDDECEIETIF